MRSAAAFALLFVAIFLLHLPLLHLPYFWDEAGYYVPAARDLLLTGDLIPHSTPSNAHPPLVMAYLAACWKVAGYSPVVTRTAMLAAAALTLLGVFHLAGRVANRQVAIAATACTALYPVFFAQSSLAQVDLAAAGLTIWGLNAYLARRWHAVAIWFSLAVLAKETAVLAPVALLVWEVASSWLETLQPIKGRWPLGETAPLKRRPDTDPNTVPDLGLDPYLGPDLGRNIDANLDPNLEADASNANASDARASTLPVPPSNQPPAAADELAENSSPVSWCAFRRAKRTVSNLRLQTLRLSTFTSLVAPVLVLCAWYAYHYARTGYVFGNPEFFRYNVQATVDPLRILLVLGMRLWQTFGYLHLWVLTLLMLWAMTRPPLRDGERERPRIPIPVQAVFGALVLTYILALALVGGAVLARYLLTVIPLVIILAVSTLWRRIRSWQAPTAIVCAAFVLALFTNPPYGFAPEDTLAYRDYVEIHQQAEAYLQAHYPQARVLTAWPASDELTRPYLGYVAQPMHVLRIENFALEEVMAAAQSAAQGNDYDVALVFSTKYEPSHRLLGKGPAWQRLKARFFGFHRDLPPELAAQILGGHVVFADQRQGQWVAVIEVNRAYEARTIQREFAGQPPKHP